MISLFVGITAASVLATAQAPTTPAAPAERTLASLPNTTITYFDVSGKDGEAIQKALANRQKEGVAPSANWEIGAGVRKRTEGTTCTVVGAEAKFTGEVLLPKLTTEATVPPEVLTQWKSYVAGLETAAAAKLWFVNERLGLVEKAILASSCEGAAAAANAAIDKIKAEEAAFVQQNAAQAK